MGKKSRGYGKLFIANGKIDNSSKIELKIHTLEYWFDKEIQKIPKIINDTKRIINRYALDNREETEGIKEIDVYMKDVEESLTEAIKSQIGLAIKLYARIIYFIQKIIDKIKYMRNKESKKGEEDLEEEKPEAVRYGERPKMSKENEAIYEYALKHPYDPNNVEIIENIIKEKEDFRPFVYDDKNPNKELKKGDKIIGYPTIGYGFRYINETPVEPGSPKSMTREEADKYLHESIINKYGKILNKNINVPITQNQYNALLSLVYNIGVSNLKERTIIILLNNGDYIGTKEAFMSYIKSKGKIDEGLVNRRRWEQRLFIKDIEKLFDFN